MSRIIGGFAATLVLSLAAPVVAAGNVVVYDNCKALNDVYPHGVGRAKNLVNKGGKSVLYIVDKAVYDANYKKDRDRDGIACEK